MFEEASNLHVIWEDFKVSDHGFQSHLCPEARRGKDSYYGVSIWLIRLLSW